MYWIYNHICVLFLLFERYTNNRYITEVVSVIHDKQFNTYNTHYK